MTRTLSLATLLLAAGAYAAGAQGMAHVDVKDATGKTVEVLIYGDGCFKDPIGGIWELADPVVSPAHTAGLSGTPNELKMKYFADNELSGLSGDPSKRKTCLIVHGRWPYRQAFRSGSHEFAAARSASIPYFQ